MFMCLNVHVLEYLPVRAVTLQLASRSGCWARQTMVFQSRPSEGASVRLRTPVVTLPLLTLGKARLGLG